MTDIDVNSFDELAARVEQLGSEVRNRKCRCPNPAHADNNPSASMYENESGHWRVKCFTCDQSWDAIDLQAMIDNTDIKTVMAQAKVVKPAAPKKVIIKPSLQAVIDHHGSSYETHYRYLNPTTGNCDLLVVRLRKGDSKSFMQWHQFGDEYHIGAGPGKLPIFNAKTVIGSTGTILVVEGEKCAIAAYTEGIKCVTTSPTGGGNADKADWSAIQYRHVVIWRDYDEPKCKDGKPNLGIKYQESVKTILEAQGCTVHCVDVARLFDGKPGGYDIADYIAEHGGESARRIIDQTRKPDTISDRLLKNAKRIVSGEIKTPDLNLGGGLALGQSSNALAPGNVTVLVASAGSGKSMTMVQILDCLYQQGCKAAAWLLEDGSISHGNRLLAQLDGNVKLLSEEWIRNNHHQYERAVERHGERINEVLEHVSYESTEATYASVGAWARSKAKAGCKVIIVDPITYADPEKDIWTADKELMRELKTIAEKNDIAVIVCTHPRDGQKPPSQGNISGGKAMSLFTHAVIWLTTCEDETAQTVDMSTVTFNRLFYILKSRNGGGVGKRIAAYFDRNTMRITDLGVLMNEGKAPSRPPPDQRPKPHDKYHTAPSDDEDLFS